MSHKGMASVKILVSVYFFNHCSEDRALDKGVSVRGAITST